MFEVIQQAPDKTAASNQTAREFPDGATLQELIEIRARLHPRHTAVLCDHDPAWGTSLFTYAQLNAKANQLARGLRKRGIGPGCIVGVLFERSFAMMLGILAVLKAGAAYLPISPGDPVDRIAYVLGDAGATLLLAHAATLSKAPRGVDVLDLEQAELYSGPDADPEPASGPSDLAYVIYTSGSTGKPKGVMVEHRSVVNRLHWMQSAYPIDGHDVLLQKTPICFDVSVWELFWGLIEGAGLCLLRPRGERAPQVLAETIRRHRVSVAHFVPSMLNVFLEYFEGRPEKVGAFLTPLRHVFASGEALGPAQVRKFFKVIGHPAGCRLTNLYGPTEATVDATYFDCPPDGEIERVPIGRPIQNMRAYILKGGRLVLPGETGELCLAGVGLARGYLNNPELSSQRFGFCTEIPGERIYHTGDVARWLPDGNIEYLGREDHQVKIRGLRIELGEIENTLREFPAIADCVVVTKSPSESVVLIIAYIVVRRVPDREALRRHLLNRLPDYMVPGHFEEIPALPLTTTGKVDRKALPEPQWLRRPAAS